MDRLILVGHRSIFLQGLFVGLHHQSGSDAGKIDPGVSTAGVNLPDSAATFCGDPKIRRS